MSEEIKKDKVEYLLICVCLHDFYLFLTKKNVEWIWKEKDKRREYFLREFFILLWHKTEEPTVHTLKKIFSSSSQFFFSLSNKFFFFSFSLSFLTIYWKIINKKFSYTELNINLIKYAALVHKFIIIHFNHSPVHHALKRISKKEYFFWREQAREEEEEKWKIFPFTVNRQPIVHYICVHFHRYLIFTHSTALLFHIYFIFIWCFINFHFYIQLEHTLLALFIKL